MYVRIKKEMDSANTEMEKAQRSGDYAKASEIKYGKLPQLQKNLKKWKKLFMMKKAIVS